MEGFFKFCGLLTIYELYLVGNHNKFPCLNSSKFSKQYNVQFFDSSYLLKKNLKISEYYYWLLITVAHKPNSIWKAAQSLFMNPENATEQILYAILKTLCSLYVLLFDEILVYSTELIFQPRTTDTRRLKTLIICGPKFKSQSQINIWDLDMKAWWFCRNNGWIMESMYQNGCW